MAKQTFDARKLMEKSVEVMRQSLLEPREDGKSSPLVGAVLWKPDGTVEAACRCELRSGDHAEYTLLERKNRHCKLDGSSLFSTLEPCAPGSRRHPKLSCAERIVLARIKAVWIGIEDPDPTVDRKGIKYLQKCGVTVHMFDRDLQEVIREANKEFLAQALERAAADEVEKKPPTVRLSRFEDGVATAALDDFSLQALEAYRVNVKISEEIGTAAFNRRFAQQGLLLVEDGRVIPTGFGLLLFGKEPRTAIRQAGLLGTIHYPDGSEETRDFDGPMVFAPEQAMEWLKDKLPNPIVRTEARRKEANEALYELVREGIVNALVHRDYSIEQAKCQLMASTDAIVVMSPGDPVSPITLEQLQSFDAPMLSRNPVLHFAFAKMDLAEERGLGLKSMKLRAERAGLPLPQYSWKAPYVVLTLYRSGVSAARAVGQKVLESLTSAEQAGWEWLAAKDTVTSWEYAEAMAVPNRTALNHLKRLTELGLLRKVGAGRATRYEIVRP